VRAGLNLKRTSLFVGLDQLEELREISERTGTRVSFMIRRGVDLYLRTYPVDDRDRPDVTRVSAE
jgi:hypothetical protein